MPICSSYSCYNNQFLCKLLTTHKLLDTILSNKSSAFTSVEEICEPQQKCWNNCASSLYTETGTHH